MKTIPTPIGNIKPGDMFMYYDGSKGPGEIKPDRFVLCLWIGFGELAFGHTYVSSTEVTRDGDVLLCVDE